MENHDAPISYWDKVYWYTSEGNDFERKREGFVVDFYYQQKTTHRREGWRVLIHKNFYNGEKNYLEKYLDEVKRR